MMLAEHRVRLGGAAMPILVTIVVAISLAGFYSLYPMRFSDFRAFYCSGRAVLAGYDPYREHPLHECEHSLPTQLLSPLPDAVTIPAPYPGYALALFALVARLPFNVAIVVWTAGASLSVGLSIALVARLTSAPRAAVAIALGFPALIIPLPLGQPTPYELLALCACAMLLHVNRPRLAALAALPTMLDPHVGLAVCLGMFIGISKARPILVAGAAALIAMSLYLFGPSREWEYLHEVLPLHGVVNVPEFSQFSTANLLFTAGVRPAIALLLGNIWFAASLAAGIAVALRLRRRFGAPAIACVPVAFAVFGGSHTHLQQLALALPAFLLVACEARGSRRAILMAATFVAALPWLIVVPFPYLFVAVSLLAIAFARLLKTPGLSLAMGASCFVALVGMCIVVATSHPRVAALTAPVHGNPLAEIAWGAYINASSVPPQAWYLAAKVPTLAAFLVLLTALSINAFGRLPAPLASARTIGTLDAGAIV